MFDEFQDRENSRCEMITSGRIIGVKAYSILLLALYTHYDVSQLLDCKGLGSYPDKSLLHATIGDENLALQTEILVEF